MTEPSMKRRSSARAMTSRDVLAQIYANERVDVDALDDFRAIREEVGRGECFEMDGWVEGDPGVASVDVTACVNVQHLGRATCSDVHAALSSVLSALADDHPLLARLLRADDARSDFLAARRWAVALGWFWGVDGQAYARAIAACSNVSVGSGMVFELQQRRLNVEDASPAADVAGWSTLPITDGSDIEDMREFLERCHG
jgi:hypothetical protein